MLLLSVVPTGLFAQQYVAQDGHLLDANNRLGSMGWNGNGRIDALSNRSSNIMTGNISGGMSFKGAVPYYSSMEFQGLSNSGTLSNFRRDSIGATQVSSGLYSGQLYIDSSKGITSSYNGNIVNTQSISKISTMVNPRQQVGNYSNSLKNSLSDSPAENGVPNIFTSISQYKPFSRSRQLSGVLVHKLKSNNRLNSKIDVSALAVSISDNSMITYDSQLRFDNIISDQQEPEINYEEQMFLEKDLPDRIFEGSITGNRVATEADTFPQIERQYQAYVDEALRNMKRGSYYKAADNFGIASIFSEPDNAKIMVYSAVARFATGEYISSSINLYKAFNISFDQTLEPIDLKTIFDSDLTVYYGVKDLERCYKLTDNPSLLFLQGYIEYIAGDKQSAKITIQKLVEANPDNELYQNMLDYLTENYQE